jgi:hypothetical protein
MSKDKRGLAVLRGLFAKAAGMASEPNAEADNDELETSLDEDFEELDAAVAASAEENEDSARFAQDKEDDAAEANEPEEGMDVVGKAHELQPQDATPLIEELVATLQGIQEVQQRQLQQSALIAKGLMGLVDEQASFAKAFEGLQEDVAKTPLARKAGKRKLPTAPAKPQPFNRGEIVAKAATDLEHFSARDVAKLESMLNAGKLEQVYQEFSPEQLSVVGLPLKN